MVYRAAGERARPHRHRRRAQRLAAAAIAGALAVGGAAAAAHDVTVATAAARAIGPGFLGFHAPLTLSRLPWSSQVADAAAIYSPGMLRYPGGTIDDYWDWQIGGINPANPGPFAQYVVGHGNPPAPALPLSDFLNNGITRTGALPIYVLNMLTDTAASQLAMLQAAGQSGQPVGYAELGNEYYFANFGTSFPVAQTAANYAAAAEQWAQAIKQAIPAIKLGALTSQNDLGGAPGPGGKQPSGWNETVAAGVPHADALIQHIYPPLTGIINNPIDAANIDLYFADPLNYIDKIMANVVPLAQHNAKEIWVTEFNAFDWIIQGIDNGSPQERQSWARGLFTAEMAVYLGGYPVTHMLVQLNGVGSYGNILFLPQPGTLAGAVPTASGLTMQLFDAAARDATTLATLEFTPNTHFSPNGAPDSHFQLIGSLFATPAGNRAVILNLGPKPVSLLTQAICPGRCQFQQRHAAQGQFATPVTGAGSIVEKTGQTSGELVLPQYSVTLLSGS